MLAIETATVLAVPSTCVLVVDDSEQIRGILRHVLTPAGYDVVECSTGTGALRRIEAGAPDLILLDLELPDISGHSLLQVIRSDPNTRLLPVVVMTGLATGAARRRAYAEGATDFLAKPFSTTELLARVQALVTLGQVVDEHEHAEHAIFALARLVAAGDPRSAGRDRGVIEYADRIARRIGFGPVEREEIGRGAFVHDINAGAFEITYGTRTSSGQSRWAKEAVDALRASLLEERETWAGAVS